MPYGSELGHEGVPGFMGELERLFDIVVSDQIVLDRLQHAFEIVHRSFGRVIFSRGYGERPPVARLAEKVNFNSLRGALRMRIGVDRNKKIRLFGIGKKRAVLQRDENVLVARHDDGFAELLLNQGTEAECDVQRHFFSVRPFRPIAPGSFPPWPASRTIVLIAMPALAAGP